MKSSGKRSGAGERVLEGRHVIGLFMLMLLFSGVFFTLGYVMGRDESSGQVRAASTGRGFGPPEVQPKPEATPKTSSSSKKQDVAETAIDSNAPTSSDWEFYHAGDSSKTDDRLKPVANPAPTSAIGKRSGAAKTSNPAAKTNAPPSLSAGAGSNLQVAAVTKESDAMALANTLRKKNFPTFVQPPHGDKYYHVLVGPYADQKAIENARKGLEAAGFKKVLVKH